LTTSSAGEIPEAELLQGTLFIANYRHKQKFSPSTYVFCNLLCSSVEFQMLLATISVKVGPQFHLGCYFYSLDVVFKSFSLYSLKRINQNVNVKVRTSVEHGSSAEFGPVAPCCQQCIIGYHRRVMTPPSCTAFRAPQSIHLRGHTHTLLSGRKSQLGRDNHELSTL
jgi:hypothetical protein